jgi:methyl coenzyme M reductase beta subunit
VILAARTSVVASGAAIVHLAILIVAEAMVVDGTVGTVEHAVLDRVTMGRIVPVNIAAAPAAAMWPGAAVTAPFIMAAGIVAAVTAAVAAAAATTTVAAAVLLRQGRGEVQTCRLSAETKECQRCCATSGENPSASR